MLIKQVIITGASSIEIELSIIDTAGLPWQGVYPAYDQNACAHLKWNGSIWRISLPVRC